MKNMKGRKILNMFENLIRYGETKYQRKDKEQRLNVDFMKGEKMELNREQIKCPYVEKVKSITGKEEFDCKNCPALECPFPDIKAEFERSENEHTRCNRTSL